MGSLARRPLPSRASQRGGEHVREVQEQSQALELLDTPLVGERFLASGALEPDLRCRPLHDTRLRTPAADRITWSRSLSPDPPTNSGNPGVDLTKSAPDLGEWRLTSQPAPQSGGHPFDAPIIA